MSSTLKPPPHDEAAEREVLGILMHSGAGYHEVHWLTPMHFWKERHRLIFRAIQVVAATHSIEEINPFTVHASLGTKADLVGSVRDIFDIVNTTMGTAANIAHHANILRDRATLRTIATEAFNAHHTAMDGHTAPLEILRNLSESVLAISSRATTSEGSVSFSDMAKELEAHVDEEQGVLLSTGYPEIDDALAGGLRPGDLWVQAGRPAQGKTALACNIAWNASSRCRPVWFGSLEMGKKPLALRIISAIESIDYDKVIQPWLMNDDERMAYGQALIRLLSNKYLRISELSSEGISSDLDALCAQAHKEQRRVGQLGLIVLDYLQLVSVAKFNHRGREACVSEASRRLKVLAMELECPIMLLAQVNRECIKRADKRPVLSDLRESGAVEQDADVVSFVYRDEYYYPPGTQRPDNAPDPPKWPGCGTILFRKIRNNPCGFVDLLWRGKHQRFDTRAVHEEERRFAT